MTLKEIKQKSKQQLKGCRFRAITIIAFAAAFELLFVFLKLIFADFLLLNVLENPFSLIMSTQKAVVLARTVFAVLKLVVSSLLLAKGVHIFCFAEQQSRRCITSFFALIALKIALSAAKLPYLICFYISIFFGAKMLFEYNAQFYEFALSLLFFAAALCLVLIYLYFLSGLFLAPLLIFSGESIFWAMVRSLDLMKNNRAKLLSIFLGSLPEALLIFTLPEIAMRFAVFAKHTAHFYCDDDLS